MKLTITLPDESTPEHEAALGDLLGKIQKFVAKRGGLKDAQVVLERPTPEGETTPPAPGTVWDEMTILAKEAQELAQRIRERQMAGYQVVPGTFFFALEQHHDDQNKLYFAQNYFVTMRKIL